MKNTNMNWLHYQQVNAAEIANQEKRPSVHISQPTMWFPMQGSSKKQYPGNKMLNSFSVFYIIFLRLSLLIHPESRERITSFTTRTVNTFSPDTLTVCCLYSRHSCPASHSAECGYPAVDSAISMGWIPTLMRMCLTASRPVAGNKLWTDGHRRTKYALKEEEHSAPLQYRSYSSGIRTGTQALSPQCYQFRYHCHGRKHYHRQEG